MTDLPKPVKQGAAIAATALETVAGVLRGIAAAGDDDARGDAPAATAAQPEPPHETRGTKPAAGTRSRISNPKAAKRVRAREG